MWFIKSSNLILGNVNLEVVFSAVSSLFIYLFFFSQKETAEESCGHTIPWEKGWILVAPTITCTTPGEKSPEQAVLISPKGARSSAPKELKFKVILHVPYILWASLQSAFSESSISCLDLASELCQGFGQNKAGSGYFFAHWVSLHGFCLLTALGYLHSADKINLVLYQDLGIWSKWGDKNHKDPLNGSVTDKVTEQGLIEMLE